MSDENSFDRDAVEKESKEREMCQSRDERITKGNKANLKSPADIFKASKSLEPRFGCDKNRRLTDLRGLKL